MKLIDAKYANFEEFIISFFAPVISGVKPANLFSINPIYYPRIKTYLQKLNRISSKKEILFTIIPKSKNRALIFAINKRLMAKICKQRDNINFLSRYNYPLHADISQTINHIVYRLKEAKEFPHEVGLFLGYPLEDVVGFIKYQGRNYLCCNSWKVYSNVNVANKLHDLYQNSIFEIRKKWEEGTSLFELIYSCA